MLESEVMIEILPEILESLSIKDFLKKHNEFLYENIENTKVFKDKIITVNKVLLISGMSGAGKDAVIDKLPDVFQRIKTCTTRKVRSEEMANDPYIRLTEEEFDLQVNQGLFIENELYPGGRYGTRIQELTEIIAKKCIPVWRIDPKGASHVAAMWKEDHPNIKNITPYIFYLVPDKKEHLKTRILKRDVEIQTDLQKKEEALSKAMDRINHFDKDFSYIKDVHYILVNPEDRLEETVEKLLEKLKSLIGNF
jgi:guanylate kinase